MNRIMVKRVRLTADEKKSIDTWPVWNHFLVKHCVPYLYLASFLLNWRIARLLKHHRALKCKKRLMKISGSTPTYICVFGYAVTALFFLTLFISNFPILVVLSADFIGWNRRREENSFFTHRLWSAGSNHKRAKGLILPMLPAIWLAKLILIFWRREM